MQLITISAIIFVLSIASLWFVISRKFVYLKKLTPEAISEPPATIGSFFASLFPEILRFTSNIDWAKYKRITYDEFEKILRRTRLIFLKVEALIQSMSLWLRRSKQNTTATDKDKEEEPESVSSAEVEIPIVETIDPKEEEQHTIMEIAKNPKDPLLYVKLGDIYLKIDDLENARLSFETVLDLDPDNWYAKKKLEQLSEGYKAGLAQW